MNGRVHKRTSSKVDINPSTNTDIDFSVEVMELNSAKNPENSVDENAGDKNSRFRILLERILFYLKFAMAFALVIQVGFITVFHGYGIVSKKVTRSNYDVWDECDYLGYFSLYSGYSIIFIGFMMIFCAGLALYIRSFKPIWVATLFAICGSFFLSYAGCFIGK